jgi:hypothetical protein
MLADSRLGDLKLNTPFLKFKAALFQGLHLQSYARVNFSRKKCGMTCFACVSFWDTFRESCLQQVVSKRKSRFSKELKSKSTLTSSWAGATLRAANGLQFAAAKDALATRQLATSLDTST